MQDPDDPFAQILQTSPIIMQFAIMAPIQAQRQGVDGEIAPVQVQLDPAALDRRQRGGIIIKFRAGTDQVKAVRQICRGSLLPGPMKLPAPPSP